MAFSAQDVAKLREITGAGMMDCKKALTQTDGDMDKAAEYLREQGISVAAKKAGRIASEGVVAAYTSEDGLCGALIEVNCESDFVAKSDDFITLANNLAIHTAKANPVDVDSCLSQKFSEDNSVSVLELINAATAKIGEKISLRRVVRQQIDCGLEENYIHMGGKIGVLLELKSDKKINCEEFRTIAHDIAMHIAAFGPKYVNTSEVPANDVDQEKAILKAQILNDPKAANKPAAVIDKMIEGRIGKFYKEICLLEQDFAKDPSKTVGTLILDYAKKAGANISIVKFTRFVMGEGLEKKNENLAEEISKLQK